MMSRTSIAKFIKQQNATNQVVVYGKTYCPYCQATKNLFKKSLPSVQVKVIELDQEENGVIMQQVLLAMTGQRTVPNVFVNNQHVGGNDDVQEAFRNGTLQKMLQKDNDNNNTPQGQNTESLSDKLRQMIQQENNSHQVVIWSKSYCPFCRATKQLFAAQQQHLANLDVVVHEIDQMDQGELLQDELESLTGQRTVPNVFINGKHVGGNSDVQALASSGQLGRLL